MSDKKPRKKRAQMPTRKEMDGRILQVIHLLAHGAKRTQIHRFCEEKWGVVWRSSENYIARARETMRESANTAIPDMVADAKAFYESVLSDSKASLRDKLVARERLDTLFGLDAPTRMKHELSGQNGGPIQTENELDLGKLSYEQIVALEGIVAAQNADTRKAQENKS